GKNDERRRRDTRMNRRKHIQRAAPWLSPSPPVISSAAPEPRCSDHAQQRKVEKSRHTIPRLRSRREFSCMQVGGLWRKPVGLVFQSRVHPRQSAAKGSASIRGEFLHFTINQS